MACVLTQGFAEECDDSLGGIKAGQFLIAQLDDITSYTEVAGEITVLTAGTFYRYWMKKETASAVSTATKDPLTGTFVVESVVTAIIQKLSNLKNTELKLLAGKPVVLIYQDQNGIWHCAGIDNGGELLAPVGQTGQTMNEQNGYTLPFTVREGHFPYTVDATVVSGLTIA